MRRRPRFIQHIFPRLMSRSPGRASLCFVHLSTVPLANQFFLPELGVDIRARHASLRRSSAVLQVHEREHERQWRGAGARRGLSISTLGQHDTSWHLVIIVTNFRPSLYSNTLLSAFILVLSRQFALSFLSPIDRGPHRGNSQITRLFIEGGFGSPQRIGPTILHPMSLPKSLFPLSPNSSDQT
ncbi:hypothetical protein DFH07DRAFT_443523 [Mycena maculata]|uniref:Uncharacterized protein n=1 Tax=Mycena maculata TaxID=230809 RepID=A0AAD7NGI3_9AGAR|nr:hypothetical protein DFH07DRAFT_443523 [Mycena maculata]